MDSNDSPGDGTRAIAHDAHPQPELLRRFGRGELDEPGIVQVVAHIEACEACRDVVDGIFRDDTFLNELRLATHTFGLVPIEPAADPRADSSFWTGAREFARRASAWPERIGDFLLLEPVGRGRLATVFRARRRGLDRDVALKVFAREDIASIRKKREFLRDVEQALNLRHENILGLYEVGQAEQGIFIASEWADAGSLRQKLDGAPWPADQAASLVGELAAAIQASHARGVAHGSLSPDSVLFVTDRRPSARMQDRLAGAVLIPKIGDLGVRAAASRALQDRTHPAGGKGADILALGGLFYQLVTGNPPPSERAADSQVDALHPSVRELAIRGIGGEPGRQFSSAGELSEAMRMLASQVGETEFRSPEGGRRPAPIRAANLAPPPSRFSDFRILREVGRGGMGVVYEAEQVSLGRRVALKVLPQIMKRDARSFERFRREARAAAQLHHTNIVPVFEVGEDGESVFYAMQFIHGQGLNLVIRELKRLRKPAKNPRAAGVPTSAGQTEEDPRGQYHRLRPGRSDGPLAADRRLPRRDLASGNGGGRRLRPGSGRPPATSRSRPTARSTTPARRPRRCGRAAARSRRRNPRAAGSRSSRAWPRSAGRWPAGSPMPMPAGSSTATSSPRTCCWTPPA